MRSLVVFLRVVFGSAAAVLGFLFHSPPSFGAVLIPADAIRLEKTQGRFDFLRIDPARHRLLLAHTGNKSLDIIDLDSERLLKSVSTGAAQDSAIDLKNHRYFVSVSSPPQMVIVDSETLEMIGDVKLPKAADLMAFNEMNGRAYVCNDEAPELWIINPDTRKILSTVEFTGKGMEGLSFDSSRRRLFQAVAAANSIQVLDVPNEKVLAAWPTDPATGPHGIDLVTDANRLLVAGANGKLVLMDCSNGKVVASCETAGRVDEITYDSQLHTVYCASGQGKISVVRVNGEQLKSMGDIASAQGCHSIIVDPKTHKVWIAFAKGEESFIQSFAVEKP